MPLCFTCSSLMRNESFTRKSSDTLFNKWMEDIAFDEQLEKDETNDDEVQEDEVQIVDIIALDQRENEDKGQ